MNKCKLLPDTTKKSSQETEEEYRERLYSVFENDFKIVSIVYNGKQVYCRINPNVKGYEEAFWHLTTRTFKSYTSFEHREFDYARAERIAWIRKIIENIPCSEDCCEGYLIWKERNRVHIYLEIESFLIVLDERKEYYVLVTSYVVFGTEEKRKYKKRYERYK